MKASRWRLWALAAVAICAASLISFEPAAAQASPAPDLFMNEAACFRHIVNDDDLFCMGRFELPIQLTDSPVSAEAWCAELDNQDGCTGANVQPTAPETLVSGAAFVTLYTGCTPNCASGSLELQDRLPRIDHALTGAYFPQGHTLIWGATDTNLCVESSASLYSLQTQSCLVVAWSTALNTMAAQRTALASTVRAMLLSIEADRAIGFNQLVTGNLVTSAGRTLAIEALSVMEAVIPAAFQASASRVIDGAYATVAPSFNLQTSIDATVAAHTGGMGDTRDFYDDLGSSWFGISGEAAGSILTFVGAAAAYVALLRVGGGSQLLAVIGADSVVLLALLLRGVTVQTVAVTMVILAVPAGMWVIRRIPT